MLINVDQAAELLLKGEVVAVPTETVYGLAASLKHPEAIDKIFHLKGRPRNNPLIVHALELDSLHHAEENYRPLAEKFWPGPLTLVLPANLDTVPESVRAGLDTVAVRMPDHPLTRELLQRTGPLVMPSANLSGKPSATQPEHVEQDFGKDFPVLDGGECSCGLESTILIFREGKWRIGRLGAVTLEELEEVLGYRPAEHQKESAPICPGQLYRHYAPKAKLILDPKTDPSKIGTVIGFNDRSYPECELFSLGNSDDPKHAAHSLYALFRQLDQRKIQNVWVDMDFPSEGLWKTLRERIQKAAQ